MAPDAAGESKAASRGRRPKSLRCDCRLIGSIVLAGKRVPPGDCALHQCYQELYLSWTSADGVVQQCEIGRAMLHQLLDEGVLERLKPA